MVIENNSSIGVGAKALYLMLRDKQRQNGENFPLSIRKMCEMLAVSKPTVLRYRNELIASGLLVETKRFGEDGGCIANTYAIIEIGEVQK
jgi:hypothetical protein